LFIFLYSPGKDGAITEHYASKCLSPAPLESPTPVKRKAEETLGSVAKKPCLEEMQLQKVKEELAARLDVPKEACVTVDNIR
jgi:hypothetical protein